MRRARDRVLSLLDLYGELPTRLLREPGRQRDTTRALLKRMERAGEVAGVKRGRDLFWHRPKGGER